MASIKGIAALLALGGAFALLGREERERKEYIESFLPENDNDDGLLEQDALEDFVEDRNGAFDGNYN